MSKCPACGATNPVTAAKCEYCEKPLPRTEAAITGGDADVVICPVCSNEVVVRRRGDDSDDVKVRCMSCKSALIVSSDGEVKLMGPHGEPYSKAEDPNIKEEHSCGECRYLSTFSRFWLKFFVVVAVIAGGVFLFGTVKDWMILRWVLSVASVLLMLFIGFLVYMSSYDNDQCLNKKARGITDNEYACNINPNLRCKFWTK